MRRSICYCEPKVALAGQKATWKFTLTPSYDLPKGSLLKFDMFSKGKKREWQLPSIDFKRKENVIWLELPNGKGVKALSEKGGAYVFILPIEVRTSEKISICLGSPSHKEQLQNQCQINVQRKREFLLYVDTKGKGNFQEPEVFHIDVRGNELYKLRIISPSFVSKNKRFDIIVRFEDKFGNLTNNAPKDTLIHLSYENLRENLQWQLFVPETGFVVLPNLYFNETGIYKIKLKNLKTKDTFFSDPIKCFEESEINLFWGFFHGQTETEENIEGILRHFRDEEAFHFFANSPFESEEETPSDMWKNQIFHVSEMNENDRFVTFSGFQWEGEPNEEGLRELIYLKEAKAILRKKDSKTNSLKKIYKNFSPKELLSIPSFTMNKSTSFDFSAFDPNFERVVEIYNAFGSSECSIKEGNLYPIGDNKKGFQEGSILKALINNRRFGFIAGGMDNRGIYRGLKAQYSPGLTAIIASEHTKESLVEALYNRSCYATTGQRILLGLYVATEPMGSELNTAKKPGLAFNRHITGYVTGIAPLKEVHLIRNGEIFKKFKPDSENLEFAIDDQEPIAKVALKAKNGEYPFLFYYLRIVQQDGNSAWSSPIWIDHISTKSKH